MAKTKKNKNATIIHPPVAPAAFPMPVDQVSPLVITTMRQGEKIQSRRFVSEQQEWESTILAHLLKRSLYFALPSIDMSNGLFGQFYPSYFAQDPQGANFATPAQNWFSAYGGNYIEKTSLSGRYNYYNGLVNTAFSVEVPANSTRDFVMFYRPDVANYPVLILNKADKLGSGALVEEELAWVQNPFFGLDKAEWKAVSGVASSLKKSPSIEIVGEETNFQAYPSPTNRVAASHDKTLVFCGGSELEYEHINRTAYTNVAWRPRTSNNTIHDFIQLFEGIDGDSLNIGVTNSFVSSPKCYQATTGSRWRAPVAYYNTTTSKLDTADPFTAFNSLQQCITNDYPVVQFIATNSGPDAAAITIQVVVRAWVGIAPLELEYAGSMGFETVPYTYPSWVCAAKTVGGVGKPNEFGVVRAAAARSANPFVAEMAHNNPKMKPSPSDEAHSQSSESDTLKILRKAGQMSQDALRATANFAQTPLGRSAVKKTIDLVNSASKLYRSGRQRGAINGG